MTQLPFPVSVAVNSSLSLPRSSSLLSTDRPWRSSIIVALQISHEYHRPLLLRIPHSIPPSHTLFRNKFGPTTPPSPLPSSPKPSVLLADPKLLFGVTRIAKSSIGNLKLRCTRTLWKLAVSRFRPFTATSPPSLNSVPSHKAPLLPHHHIPELETYPSLPLLPAGPSSKPSRTPLLNNLDRSDRSKACSTNQKKTLIVIAQAFLGLGPPLPSRSPHACHLT